jgi:1,2-dihydroxy-3-keto-5-methylthiopentene dioxygenase
MSRLTIYKDDAPGHPVLRTEDAETMARELAPLGVRFERWESPVALSPDADAETILAAYKPYLDGLMGSTGAGSADVVRMRPDTPNIPAIRAKFLSEHTHSEDEVRFFVHGSGNFILHTAGKVFDVHCTQGDLLSVPAGTKHWFDAGEQPNFTALRVFTDTSGWVPEYTGAAISEAFPAA